MFSLNAIPFLNLMKTVIQRVSERIRIRGRKDLSRIIPDRMVQERKRSAIIKIAWGKQVLIRNSGKNFPYSKNVITAQPPWPAVGGTLEYVERIEPPEPGIVVSTLSKI